MHSPQGQNKKSEGENENVEDPIEKGCEEREREAIDRSPAGSFEAAEAPSSLGPRSQAT